jgi:hypothetical protein
MKKHFGEMPNFRYPQRLHCLRMHVDSQLKTSGRDKDAHHNDRRISGCPRGTAGRCVCEDRTRRATSDAASVRPIKELRRHAFALSRRDAPKELDHAYPRKAEGAGKCRVHAAPAVSRASCTRKCAHEHTGSAEAIRHSLRNGFTAYAALSPATNSSCHRHRRIEDFAEPGWVWKTSADLTPATGARTTRFCRTQPPVFAKRLNRALAPSSACR